MTPPSKATGTCTSTAERQAHSASGNDCCRLLWPCLMLQSERLCVKACQRARPLSADTKCHELLQHIIKFACAVMQLSLHCVYVNATWSVVSVLQKGWPEVMAASMMTSILHGWVKNISFEGYKASDTDTNMYVSIMNAPTCFDRIQSSCRHCQVLSGRGTLQSLLMLRMPVSAIELT